MDPCPTGTAASYAANSYWLGNQNLVLTFPADWYTSKGDLAIPADQVLIQLDPKGPNTLLLNTLGKWNLRDPNKHVELHFNFQISGSVVTSGWAHGAAATEDATVMASTVVYANPMVRSNSYLTPTGRVDQAPGARYDTGQHPVEVVVELTSNKGVCSLVTYGLHFG